MAKNVQLDKMQFLNNHLNFSHLYERDLATNLKHIIIFSTLMAIFIFEQCVKLLKVVVRWKNRFCSLEQVPAIRGVLASGLAFPLALSGMKCNLPFSSKQTPAETMTTAHPHIRQSWLDTGLLPTAVNNMNGLQTRLTSDL